ncbi:MAG: hypothetical protein RLZZ50_807, partial [Verrucomicrobiota bacterium]
MTPGTGQGNEGKSPRVSKSLSERTFLSTSVGRIERGGETPPMIENAPPSDRAGWRLEHTYAALPAVLHADAAPTPVRAPRGVLLNAALARELGRDSSL